MRTNSVLILGRNRNRVLTEALLDAGFAPIVRETVEGSLKTLRLGKFAAVILDRTNTDEDALEFMLNVRDIDADIPFIVVGEAAEQIPAALLLSQENTRSLQMPFRAQELIDQLNMMETAQRTGKT